MEQIVYEALCELTSSIGLPYSMLFGNQFNISQDGSYIYIIQDQTRLIVRPEFPFDDGMKKVVLSLTDPNCFELLKQRLIEWSNEWRNQENMSPES